MIVLKYPKLLFLINRDGENASKCSVLSNWLRKSLGNRKTDELQCQGELLLAEYRKI